MHDFLTVAAATPLQVAGITALGLGPAYYEGIRAEYAQRRDVMLRVLAEAGFEVASPPAGAYYVMADCSHLGLGDDVATARHLVEHVGVAAVPGLVVRRRPCRRRAPVAVRVLQAGRDAGSRGRAPQPTVSVDAMSSGPGSSGSTVWGRQYTT